MAGPSPSICCYVLCYLVLLGAAAGKAIGGAKPLVRLAKHKHHRILALEGGGIRAAYEGEYSLIRPVAAGFPMHPSPHPSPVQLIHHPSSVQLIILIFILILIHHPCSTSELLHRPST